MSEWTREDIDMCLNLLAQIAQYTRADAEYLLEMSSTEIMNEARDYAKRQERDRQEKKRSEEREARKAQKQQTWLTWEERERQQEERIRKIQERIQQTTDLTNRPEDVGDMAEIDGGVDGII